MTAGSKPSSSVIAKILSEAVHILHFATQRLTFKQGQFHQLYISNDMEHYQLILPTVYKKDVL